MIKQIVTVASFALGGAGIVLIGYLSSEPTAFTGPVAAAVESRSAARVAPRLDEAPATVDVDETLVVFPEATLGAKRRTVAKPASFDALDPCSDFRDVGAMFVDTSGATGVRRVRQLCSNEARR